MKVKVKALRSNESESMGGSKQYIRRGGGGDLIYYKV